MLNRCDATQDLHFNDSSRRSRRRFTRGQSVVEFALISTVALMVMLIGIQFAIIGQAAVSVGQGASALARYAAINPGTLGPNGSVAASSLPTQAYNLLSSTILTNSGADLTVTTASYSGNSTNTTSSPGYNDRAVITLSYNASGKIFLPSNSLLGISFPTTLTGSESQMYE